MANKPLWDFMDEVEGKKKGYSWKKLQEELEYQGYKKSKRRSK